MSDDTRSEPEGSEGAFSAVPANLVGTAEDTQSEPSEEPVVSSSSAAPAPPQFFSRLKEHCDQHGLKSSIDLSEPFPNVAIEFKNGRSIRTVNIGSESEAIALLDLPLGEF